MSTAEEVTQVIDSIRVLERERDELRSEVRRVTNELTRALIDASTAEMHLAHTRLAVSVWKEAARRLYDMLPGLGSGKIEVATAQGDGTFEGLEFEDEPDPGTWEEAVHNYREVMRIEADWPVRVR